METLASLYKRVRAPRKHTTVKSMRLFCEATLLQCSGPPGGAEQQLTTAAALCSSGWSGPGLLVLLEFTLAPFSFTESTNSCVLPAVEPTERTAYRGVYSYTASMVMWTAETYILDSRC